MKRRYWVYIYKDPEEPDVLAVPGVHSDGDTREEAIGNVLEALEDGKPLPDDVQTMRVEVTAA
ncbi:MAG: type II toxin-antitoxin system HicB family antitoxin [Meiothermus sp.]